MKVFQVYLLYGGDRVRMREEVGLIGVGMGVRGVDERNFFGGEVGLEEVIHECETYSIFHGGRKLVKVHNFEELGGKKELCEYIGGMNDRTVLILMSDREEGIDGGLMGVVRGVGGMVKVFKKKSENEFRRMVLRKGKELGVEIEGEVMDYLVERVKGLGDMEGLMGMIFEYCQRHGVLRMEEVKGLVLDSGGVGFNIFEYIDCLFEKEVGRAMRLYRRLEGKNVGRVVSMIFRQLRLIWEVKGLKGAGYSMREVGERMGLGGYLLRKLEHQGKGYSFEELEGLLGGLRDLDEDLKSGVSVFEDLKFDLYMMSFRFREELKDLTE